MSSLVCTTDLLKEKCLDCAACFWTRSEHHGFTRLDGHKGHCPAPPSSRTDRLAQRTVPHMQTEARLLKNVSLAHGELCRLPCVGS